MGRVYTKLVCDHGSLDFWFKPNWSGTNAGGTGPGTSARLMEVGAWSTNASIGWCSLYLNPAGTALSFSAQADGISTNFLTANITWLSNEWYHVALTYSSSNTALYLDGQLAASGPGVTVVPSETVRAGGFCIGSDNAGQLQARGQFENLTTYNYPLASYEVAFKFAADWPLVAALTPGEGGQMMSGGAMSLQLEEMNGMSGISHPSSNLWLDITDVTNASATVVVHSPETNGVYDLLVTTNLSPNVAGLNLTNWQWLLRCQPGQTNLVVTNLTVSEAYFRLGTTNDSDGDGLSDAFEVLVSHSLPGTNDSDGDGMPDGWMWQHFGHAMASASDNTRAQDDYDGDFLSNWYEYTNGTDPNTIVAFAHFPVDHVNSNSVTGTIELLGGLPAQTGTLLDSTNFAAATWNPFSTNLTVNLGTTDGLYHVWIALRGHVATQDVVWERYTFTRDTTSPSLIVTEPATNATARPMIQIVGYSPEPLASLSYDLTNTAGLLTNQPGFITEQVMDTNTYDFTTNYFQCFDLPLAEGTNTVTIHATDLAGNVTVTNFTYTFAFSNATTAPGLQLYFPQDGARLSGTNFTLRGWVDDPTVTVSAQIVDTNGVTNVVAGLVERNGLVWVEGLPLASGENTLSLTATNVAGYMTTTNFTVTKSDVALGINALPESYLPYGIITVYGTISDSNYTVWVNGVAVTNFTFVGQSTWTWEAQDVPLNVGGTALVEAKAIPNSDIPTGGGGTPSNADLGNPSSTNAIVDVADQEVPSHIRVKYYQENNYAQGPGLDGADAKSFDRTWANDTPSVAHWRSIYFPPPDPPSTNGLDCFWPADRAIVPNGPSKPGTQYEWSTEGSSSTNDVGSFAIPHAHYDVDTRDDDAEDPVEYHSQARIGFELVTGGKAGSFARKQNLFTIRASAIRPVDDRYHFWLDDQNWTGIPSEDLTAFGQHFGSDGNLFLTFPDNATIPFTVDASYKNYVLNMLNQTKHRMWVFANGYPLADERVRPLAKYIVGQYIAFTPVFNPDLPDGTQKGPILWELDGNCYNDGTNAVPGVSWPTCSSNYFLNGDLLTNETTTAWWVSGGNPKQYHAHVGEYLTFANGQQLSVTAKGLFHMYRPQAQITTETGTVTITNAWGDLELTYGVPAKPGITFTNTINVPVGFSGETKWLQVINSALRRGQTNDAAGIWYRLQAARVLDNDDPYPGTTGPNSAEDSPGQPLAWWKSASVSDSFSMWLMFRPASGEWVPLRIADWDWSGTATLSGTQWVLTDPNNTPNPSDSETETYPLWTNNIVNLNQFHPE